MYRFLIVDDEQSVHIALKALLDWNSFGIGHLLSAYNGSEAIAMMRNEPVDAVFVDMNMPVSNGIDFLKEATVLFPNTRFVVISGYDSFTYAQAALKLHVEDYLLKPIDGEELTQVVEKIVRRLPNDSAEQYKTQPTVEKIREFIDRSYGEDITLTSLENMFHFSSEYLNRKFRAEYGSSVGEYLQGVRMRQAKRLLADTDMNMQDISNILGYHNANYFGKAFRKYYGETPSEYRERKKEDNDANDQL